MGVKTLIFNKRNMLGAILIVVAAPAFIGCSGVSLVSMKDYSGQAPNGTLGTVAFISNQQQKGYRGLAVEIVVNGFGEIPGINPDKVQDVSAELVKYAKLSNDKVNYTETQYYYTYWTKDFSPKSRCKLTLYYMVRPDAANDSLRFIYDYKTGNGKAMHLEQQANVFINDSKPGSNTVKTGSTTIQIN